MRYGSIVVGRFISRPNRFVAHVEMNGEPVVCHVKNTGRCRELFVKDARVVLSEGVGAGRKTRYDLVAVYKGDRLINIDSQAPNRVFREWAESGGFLPDTRLIRPEYGYGRSRLDFYVEAGGKRCLVEVKGVTLEEDGHARFPDAPTQRGTRHMEELAQAVSNGYESYAIFVIQMHGARSFSPNAATDPAFAKALESAAKQGVHVAAFDCLVAEDEVRMGRPVEVFI